MSVYLSIQTNEFFRFAALITPHRKKFCCISFRPLTASLLRAVCGAQATRGVFLGDLPQASRPSSVPHYSRLGESQAASGPAARGALCVCIGAYRRPTFSPPNSMMELITESVFYLSKQSKKETGWKERTHRGNILRRGTQSLLQRTGTADSDSREHAGAFTGQNVGRGMSKIPFYFCQTALETFLA